MSSFFAMPHPQSARRIFLARSGLVLSGAAVALLAGRDVLAAKSGPSKAGDVQILNTALGAELEAIAAYQLGAESGLLQKPALDLAVTFQDHHKQHADVLAKTIGKLGGRPVMARTKYAFPAETLKTQADVLRFAAMLEKGGCGQRSGTSPVSGSAVSQKKLKVRSWMSSSSGSSALSGTTGRARTTTGSMLPVDCVLHAVSANGAPAIASSKSRRFMLPPGPGVSRCCWAARGESLR